MEPKAWNCIIKKEQVVINHYMYINYMLDFLLAQTIIPIQELNAYDFISSLNKIERIHSSRRSRSIVEEMVHVSLFFTSLHLFQSQSLCVRVSRVCSV